MACWAALGGSAQADTPLVVTPYSGFNPILTRAPYVTDLTQTSAYINWATTSDVPGSVQVAPTANGVCPATTTVWTPTATPVPTSLPAAVNPTAPGSADLTGWQFTVIGNLGSVKEYQSSVDVTGLTPGTQYCYAVFSTRSASAVDLLPAGKPTQVFTTLAPASTSSTAPVTFDVIDDTGENYAYTSASGTTDVPFPGGVNPDQASLYNQIGSSGAQFLMIAGDTAYSGGDESNFGDLEQTGTQPEVSNIFGPSYFPQTGGIPVFAAVGDHNQNPTDLKVFPTPNTVAASGGTYAYDSYDAANVDGITGSSADDWYAFSTGDVRIYVIDAAWAEGISGRLGNTTGSLCPNGSYCQGYQADADEHWQTSSPEYQWLQRDLAAHPGGIKLAVFHYPLRSDNATQPSDPYVQNSPTNPGASTSLEALLAANGVDIAFNGHAHTYSRIEPKGKGQVINYVTGGGGGVLEPVLGGTTCTALKATEAIYALGWTPSETNPDQGNGSSCGAPTPQVAAEVYNFLKVTVAGDTVTVTPTNAAGATFDVQTYTFHPAITPSTPGDVTATLTSPTSVQLSWSPSTEAGGTIASYQIDRNGTPLTTVSAATTSYTDATVQPDSTYTYSVTAVDSKGVSSWPGSSSPVQTFSPPVQTLPGGSTFAPTPVQSDCTTHMAPGSVVGAAALDDGSGYYEVDASGDVAAGGTANCYGSLAGMHLNAPIVGMSVDQATGGYWLVASDGGVFAFNAPFYGAMAGQHLNKPIVGMASTLDGSGYWLVASDGGVFSSTDAPFYGSMGGVHLNKPIVGMALDRITGGYWLVASDGGVFSFNAPFFGSLGDVHLNKPVVGIDPLAEGNGYRLIAADGGVFTSFSAPFYGSTGSIRLNSPVIAGVNDNADNGYWLFASDGGVFTFNAPFLGSTA